MNRPVRRVRPIRSVVEQRARYRDYKPDLRNDFSESCGYCDAPDWMFGGTRGFQVDHFAPQNLFPALELIYSNLVYSCSYCNRAKWHKWIGNDPSTPNDGTQGFIDPCDLEYEVHLERAPEGEIVALSPLGEYIVRELKLNLIRHKFIGQVHKLNELKRRIRVVVDNLPDDADSVDIRSLLEEYTSLDSQIEQYIRTIQA